MGDRSADTDREAARVLQAASEQVELALQQSQPSVDALAEALRKLAAMLAAPEDAVRAGTLVAMRAEMLRAITCLQFHDRMTQHLTHVRDYLSGSAAQLGEQGNHDDERWNGLHRRLRDRLLSETQRMYLGRNFQAGFFAGGDTQAENRPASPPGDIDLF